MASLKDRIQELTECAICLCELDDPKSLPCLHTFCLKCVKDYCRDKSPGDQLDCPACRLSFMIPLPGIEQLQSNFLMCNLIEAKEAVEGTVKPGQVLCDVCSEDSDSDPSSFPAAATVYCNGFNQKLCARCSKAHQNIPGGAHQVVPLERNILELQESFCTIHPGNKLEIYCTACHLSICLTCHDMKHREHGYVDIYDIYKTFSQTLSRDIEQVTAKELSLLQEVRHLELEHKKYVDGLDSIEKEIRAAANELKRCIDATVEQMIAKISDRKMEALKVTNAKKNDLKFVIADLRTFMRSSRELLERGSPSYVTQAFDNVHEKANGLLKHDLLTDNCILPEVEVSANDLYDAVAEFIDCKPILYGMQSDRQLTRAKNFTARDTWKFVPVVEEDKPIWALTTLNGDLFVYYQGNTDIKVYDTETYIVQRSLTLPQLGGATDMTSCKRYQCVYISDWENKVVHRVDNENTITQWSVNDRPSGLSVNSVYNVLVTCDDVGKIKEFTTDGKLIRVISLQSDVIHPSHTVELIPGQFVVCHGGRNDPLHRVCIVDSSGRVLLSYGGSPGPGIGQLNGPISLAVIGELILVTDCNNHRVLMLSQSLCYIREVVPGPRCPMRMFFDKETDRSYVAFNKWENNKYVSGHVTVYESF